MSRLVIGGSSDLRSRLLQVLAFHAEGKPPDWPDDCARWPGALNTGWLMALYIKTYGEDRRLFGLRSPFVVDGRVCESATGPEFRDALHALIREGVLEVVIDPEGLHGHRFRYRLPAVA